VAAQEILLDRSSEEARRESEEAIASGRALESFRRIVEVQGGEPRVADDPVEVLPRAPLVRPIRADRSGHLTGVDAERVGRAAVALGAGRRRKGDEIDPATGIILGAKVGERLETGQEIGEIHARDEDAAAAAETETLAALEIRDAPAPSPPLVYRWLAGGKAT
jgi:thymidine phosphorylase